MCPLSVINIDCVCLPAVASTSLHSSSASCRHRFPSADFNFTICLTLDAITAFPKPIRSNFMIEKSREVSIHYKNHSAVLPAFLCISMLLLLLAVCAFAEEMRTSALNLEIRSDKSLEIGHVSKIQWFIENLSDHPVVVLEIQPEQTCEDSIRLVRSLYGDVTYLEKFDQYLYDALPQKSSLIPVYEGYIAPGKTLLYSSSYRPFSQSEKFTVSYAILGDQKVYFRKEADSKSARFAIDGKDASQVIIPRFLEAEKRAEKLQIRYKEIGGKENSLCYCESLGAYQQYPPYSMCKEWDMGESVQFRVGDKQEGRGLDHRSAGWKFVDSFDVFYGDGMYTQGEFISIPPEQAVEFMKKVEGKFSFKKIDYFLSEHYYDLEPTE